MRSKPHRGELRRGSNPLQRATSSRTTYRSRRRFLFQRNAVSPSLRRSSSQNQNRTGAPHLVYNFGIPLCWVLILYGKTVLFVYRIAGKQSTHPGWPFLAQKEGIRKLSAHAIGHVHEPVQTLANSLIFSHTFGGGIPAPKYPAKKCLRIPTSVPCKAPLLSTRQKRRFAMISLPDGTGDISSV